MRNRVRFFLYLTTVAILVASRAVPVRAAVANFCWCGFFAVSSEQENEKKLAVQLEQVYRHHLQHYENRENGVIAKLLRRLKWDEMNYYGYVALPRNADGDYPEELENLETTYGLFLAVEQVLGFAPDITRVNGQNVKTYTTYIFGSLNLFHLESRQLISSRPFFIIHSDRKPGDSAAMLDLALEKFARRLDNPEDRFTKAMLKQWQDFFGPPGEQRDVVRRAEGALDETFGVAPLCPGCIRIKGDRLDESSEKQLKTFIRAYFNARMAKFRPVVFLPAFRGRIIESVQTLITTTKEGDVTYTDECLSGYDDSGQTQLCIRFPAPRNLVKLSLRCLVEEEALQGVGEGSRKRTYNTVLDIALFFPGRQEPKIKALSNVYEQLLSSTRKPSPLYYFNSVINAIAPMPAETLE